MERGDRANTEFGLHGPARIPLSGELTSEIRVAVVSAKKHKRQQRRKRQSLTAKREKSQTPKFKTAIQTSPNLT